LARRISGKFPALPVLLYTGYAENLDERQLARAGVRALLRKPVEPDLLFAALRDALAAKRIAAP
jgi:CheY-like chemotaxis protein